MSEQLGLGKLITTPQQRDAIHIAVAPVVAGEVLNAGDRVFFDDGKALGCMSGNESVGVVDPFLRSTVHAGQTFWLFLNPGSITSLRHDWTHPEFRQEAATPMTSEQWMRAWAVEHMGYDYYGDEERLSDERAYANAIEAGYSLSVGPYESAADHIDNEWWAHWEAITGSKGQRGEYFRCAC